ncbi:MAG: hypothetical protein QNJ68_14670 [Microcoleaceae cyanobacterium MO_207.B10]|nr:hypothetical protein [Microcoleaceae cyanobacterium MO_207.B10]
MASKLLMSHPTSTLSSASRSGDKTRTLERMKSLYQTDQQVKFLHLEAEVETLLLELKTLKERNLISNLEK